MWHALILYYVTVIWRSVSRHVKHLWCESIEFCIICLDHYTTGSLPDSIPEKNFQSLHKHADEQSLELWDIWYKKDETGGTNNVQYVLQPHDNILETEAWADVEKELTSALRDAAKRCVKAGKLDMQSASKFFQSGKKC